MNHYNRYYNDVSSRFFELEISIVPDFDIYADAYYWSDDEPFYLKGQDEHGPDYIYRVTIYNKYYIPANPFLIPWFYEIVQGSLLELGDIVKGKIETYSIHLKEIRSQKEETQAIIDYFYVIDQNREDLKAKGVSIASVLQYHFDRYHHVEEFLNYVKDVLLKSGQANSRSWLRVTAQILQWYNNSLAEIEGLVNGILIDDHKIIPTRSESEELGLQSTMPLDEEFRDKIAPPEPTTKKVTKNTAEPVILATNENGLSLRQVALSYNYQDLTIKDIPEANAIARKFGHTSGDKLKRASNKFIYSNNRTGTGTEKENYHKRKDFEAVISYLKAVDMNAARKAEGEYLVFLNNCDSLL